MVSLDLKPINMSQDEQPLISEIQESADIPQVFSPTHESPSSPSDQATPRHASTFSTSPQKEHLKPPASKQARRNRGTWAGPNESQSKRQPVSIPGRHDRRDGHTDRSPRHYQEYLPEGGMYVLYEDQNIGRDRVSPGDSVGLTPPPFEEESIQIDGRHGRARDTSNTFIGEIDGRFSFSEGNVDDYVRVEINADSTSTSHELMQCKKTVLKPYLIFLKVIGWRRLRESPQDLNRSKLSLCFNMTYPLIIFLGMVATIITQTFTCYFRSQPAYFPKGNDSFLVISCTNHLVVDEIIPAVLILTAYLYGVYIFRWGEPEHLAALIETVFLSNTQQVGVSKKRIIWVLRNYLICGTLWIVFDFSLNIVRIFSLRLLGNDSTFIRALLIPSNREINGSSTLSTEEQVLRYVFTLFSLFGFVLFDLLYFAVVIAYVSQSQLIQYYIQSIMDKVRTKAYSLEDAVKDIRQTYNYIQVLNSKLSTLTTLMLFLFLGAVLSSVYSLAQYPEKDHNHNNALFVIGVLVGIGNILQWSALTAPPVIQAARLTSACRQLRRLGLEIGSRPFVYAGTPQLDLDYFVQYTNATRYTAKLASVPIYPSFVVGLIFIGGIIGSFTISIHNHFVFARWF